MLRTLIFVGALLTPSLSFAQQAIGAQEIDGAFRAIERRCSADLPRTFAPAIAGINALVVERGGAPIEAEATRDGVLRAYATALASTPALDEAELARAAVQSIGTAADGQREDDYYIDFREYRDCDCHASIGVELLRGSTAHTVVRPLEGAPAEGVLMAGDRIVAIDGVDVTALPLARVVRMLRGAIGTVVSVTVARGESAPVSFQITRAVIRLQSVVSLVDDGIGYIEIRSFQENTAERVRAAIRDMRRQSVRGYIIDLRNNSGGLLDQAIETADLFLDGGVVTTVLSARRCPAEDPEIYHARAGDVTLGAPLVIITNAQTASGAELVASALVDRQRAVTVGQRTFGMGEIQTVAPLGQRAGLRLVTGELSSPLTGRFAGGRPPTHETPEGTPGNDPAMTRARELLAMVQN